MCRAPQSRQPPPFVVLAVSRRTAARCERTGETAPRPGTGSLVASAKVRATSAAQYDLGEVAWGVTLATASMRRSGPWRLSRSAENRVPSIDAASVFYATSGAVATVSPARRFVSSASGSGFHAVPGAFVAGSVAPAGLDAVKNRKFVVRDGGGRIGRYTERPGSIPPGKGRSKACVRPLPAPSRKALDVLRRAGSPIVTGQKYTGIRAPRAMLRKRRRGKFSACMIFSMPPVEWIGAAYVVTGHVLIDWRRYP